MNFVIDVAVKAALLLALGRLVLLAFRRLSAGNRHVIAAAFLLATALLPLLSVAMPQRTLKLLPATPPLTELISEAAADVIRNDLVPRVAAVDAPELAQQSDVGSWGGEIVVGDTSLVSGSSPRGLSPQEGAGSLESVSETAVPLEAGVEESSVISLPALSLGDLVVVLLALWVLGALVVLARLGMGIGRIVWMRARSKPAPLEVARITRRVAARFGMKAPAVLVSHESDVPFVCGLHETTIILPLHSLEWSHDRLAAVLTHEMAHVKRRDCFTLMLGRVTVALHWFNPLAWGLEKESRRLCERACDDVVLESGEAPSDYASHILEIARGLPDHDNLTSVALAVSRKSEIEGRLMAILHPSMGRGVMSKRAILGLSMSVLLIAVTAATFRLGAAPVATEPAVVVDEAIEPDATITVTPNGLAPAETPGMSASERKAEGKSRYSRGWELHREGDYRRAAEEFRAAAELGYRAKTAWYNAACGYARLGEETRALAALAMAIDHGWEDSSHMLHDADLASLRRSPGMAALVARIEDQCDEERVHSDVDCDECDEEDALSGLAGEIAALARQLDDELRYARKAMGLDDLNEAAYNLLINGEVDRGIAALKEAIRRSDETSTRAMYNLACVEARSGNHDEAIHWLEKSVAQGLDRIDLLRADPDLDPIRETGRFASVLQAAESLSLQSVGGHGYGKDERRMAWENAAKDWSRILRHEPRNGRAWSNLGFAHYHLRDFESAEKAFLRALQFGYQPGSTSYNIAATYAQREHADAAFHWLKKAEARGFDVSRRFASDDDLRNLRDDRRAREYMKTKARLALAPLPASPRSAAVLSAAPSPAVALASYAAHPHPEESLAALAPLPPIPPLPPLPPVPPVYGGVEGPMLLVRGDSMIINTDDDMNLSASRSGGRVRLTLDGEKYIIDTSHLFLFPLDGEVWITEDRATVDRVFSVYDSEHGRAMTRELRKEERELQQEHRTLLREYEKANRRQEQLLRRFERVRSEADRRELLEEIEEHREDQEEKIREIEQLIHEREMMVQRFAQASHELEHLKEERTEELREIMEKAAENGKARRLR